MNNDKPLSKPTKDLLSFIKSLSSARNVRVYTPDEQSQLDLQDESSAVRRSIIRKKNTKSSN